MLTHEAIRKAIDDLTSRRIHPFFLAYLWIRKYAVDSATEDGIPEDWEELKPLLRVPGGPPNKPYFRPTYSSPNKAARYWLNPNVAGSWNASSLRIGQPPLKVVDYQDGGFALRENHAELALEHLLYGDPLDPDALAIFLYRNYGFDAGGQPDPRVITESFREHFAFRAASPVTSFDFDTLFALKEFDGDTYPFEPFLGSEEADSA